MEENHQISIRPMKKKDLREATMIMTHAFRSKLIALSDWSDEKIAKLLYMSKVFDEENLEGFYVASIKGEVAGLIHLDWLEQQKNRKLPKVKVGEIIRFAGIKAVLISSLTLIFFDEKVQKGAVAVETIAVSPKYRGKGIGSALLTFGENFARERGGIHKYVLRVVGQNEGAIKLYKRFGFKIVATKKHSIMKHLTTVKIHHFMEKLLI